MRTVYSLLILVLLIAIGISLKQIASAAEAKIEYTYIGYKVGNMAETIRDVPTHPDDSSTHAGPIKETKYGASSMLTINAGYKWKISERVRLGTTIKWILHPLYYFSDKAERNYTNDPGSDTRGYGAALTFVALEARGVIPFGDWFLNYTPQLELEYTLDEYDKKFILGTSITYFKMQAVTGWDRYDELTPDKRYTLTHVIPLGLYLNWKDFVTIGCKYNFTLSTDIGKTSDADIEKFNVFIAIGKSNQKE